MNDLSLPLRINVIVPRRKQAGKQPATTPWAECDGRECQRWAHSGAPKPGFWRRWHRRSDQRRWPDIVHHWARCTARLLCLPPGCKTGTGPKLSLSQPGTISIWGGRSPWYPGALKGCCWPVGAFCGEDQRKAASAASAPPPLHPPPVWFGGGSVTQIQPEGTMRCEGAWGFSPSFSPAYGRPPFTLRMRERENKWLTHRWKDSQRQKKRLIFRPRSWECQSTDFCSEPLSFLLQETDWCSNPQLNQVLKFCSLLRKQRPLLSLLTTGGLALGLRSPAAPGAGRRLHLQPSLRWGKGSSQPLCTVFTRALVRWIWNELVLRIWGYHLVYHYY